MHVRSLTKTDIPDDLQTLVRGFQAHELDQRRAISGLVLNLDALVSATFDNIDAELQPYLLYFQLDLQAMKKGARLDALCFSR